MPNHAPFGRFWGFEPLKIVDRQSSSKPPKGTSLGDDASFKPWLKSVQGFDLGRVPRKKYNQDRTTKSHRSVIFHIFWGKLPVKLIQ